MTDITCSLHGRKLSEHNCFYCCICFKDLTIKTANKLPNGKVEDVCKDCAEKEKQH